PTAFMAWLGIVMVWFAVTVLRGRREPFASGAVAAGLLVVLSLNILNPDALIARLNAARAVAGAEFDAAYAASLSGDAVPELIASLEHLTPANRCVVAARILERWPAAADADWRTWNLGRWRARRIVDRERSRLERIKCEPIQAPS
ncbi:MAG: DUF4173 domain-containing protein, partial [Gemmatimonadales bacterium]|nr:DUF4173 domain-containing protein [Gemmatimonadales bacterium]